MAINIRAVDELLGYEFVIPEYQRGYRWEGEHVTALLDDLEEFLARRMNSSSQYSHCNFYCLQPIVVVPDETGPTDKEGKPQRYIVVDGQQRLTTIYLILHAFGLSAQSFSLKMPGRDRQQTFIDTCGFADNGSDWSGNIDNFYMRKAYESIQQWRQERLTSPVSQMVATLFTSTGFGYAAIIWYEIADRDALAAFRRLNYGKIPLTSAELVKALLLQTDIYPDNLQILMQALAQRRSMEWDEMEHRLADPMFASMVCSGPSGPERMDIVIDFVADELNTKLTTPHQRRDGRDRDTFNYIVVADTIKTALEEARKTHAGQGIREQFDPAPARRLIVEQIWERFQSIFNLLCDWFSQRDWYHLIGLDRILSAGENTRDFIRRMYLLTESGKTKRDKFTDALRRDIGKKLRQSFNGDMAELNYEESSAHRRKMVQILTAYNVRMAMLDPQDRYRFPFHLYHEYKTTSLEHIHPQHITSNIKAADLEKWLDDRVRDIRSADDKVWLKTAGRLGIKATEDDSEQIEKTKERVEEAVGQLRQLLADRKAFDHDEKIREQAEELAKLPDTLFGDMAGIDPKELHSIANMALVDKDTNSALGNRHLDKKREILQEHAVTIDKATGRPKTFVPEETRKVFSKALTPANPRNMKFWQPEDRSVYMQRIREAYDYFTTPTD